MERKKIPTKTEKPLKTFEGAKKNAQDLKDLKAGTETTNKGGRPIKGKSPADYDIRFKVDEETFLWLQKQTTKADGMPAKERTAHAVAKKIVVAQCELINS